MRIQMLQHYIVINPVESMVKAQKPGQDTNLSVKLDARSLMLGSFRISFLEDAKFSRKARVDYH